MQCVKELECTTFSDCHNKCPSGLMPLMCNDFCKITGEKRLTHIHLITKSVVIHSGHFRFVVLSRKKKISVKFVVLWIIVLVQSKQQTPSLQMLQSE